MILTHPYLEICAGVSTEGAFDFNTSSLHVKFTTGAVGEVSFIPIGQYWSGFGKTIVYQENQNSVSIKKVANEGIYITNLVEGQEVEMTIV